MPTGKGTYEHRPCAKGCGKLVDPRGAHRHETTCQGPQGGGGPSRPVKRQYRRRKVTARHVPELRKARRARPGNAGDGRTEGCQVCGLNVAERALVGEAIRAGLSFDNAVGFIRHARATFGKEAAR